MYAHTDTKLDKKDQLPVINEVSLSDLKVFKPSARWPAAGARLVS